jgi:glyceraldehyde 3-phosphate dehydrogenase
MGRAIVKEVQARTKEVPDMRVAINGFGRIGRTVFRLLQSRPGLEVVGINDTSDAETMAYLLRHDSVRGRFPGRAEIDDGRLVTDRGAARLTAIRNPADLPWKELGVDVVVESTGTFRKRDELANHLHSGARKVILTAPAKDKVDATIVIGVNDEALRPEHRIVSSASCITNGLAPLAYVLDREFGLEHGLMTATHAYTNDQSLVDTPHNDLRRARAATLNIVPTTTAAARAVGEVLPHLKGRLDGMALRVPVPCGSIIDLVSVMKKDVTVSAVNAAMKAASESARLTGILGYAVDPLVSTDVVGDSHSCLFDPGCTSVIAGRTLKTISWYDNEWGYSARVCDLLSLLEKIG